MQPEQEALRLSAMVALCVGVYIIALSVDNFEQSKSQMPNRIGELECNWWRTTFGGCAMHNKRYDTRTQYDQIDSTGARVIKL